LPHAPPKATEAAATKATEATSAASRRIAGTPSYGYAKTREGARASVQEQLGAPVGLRRVLLGRLVGELTKLARATRAKERQFQKRRLDGRGD